MNSLPTQSTKPPVKINYIFRRVETKYLLTGSQYKTFLEKTENLIHIDEYGKSTICNLYFDTKNKDMIRRSLEKPVFKEKIRLRSYNTPRENSTVFLENKKKFEGIVYKRRISVPLSQALKILSGEETDLLDSQILKEMKYTVSFYNLVPSVYIAYDRVAYIGNEDADLRITIDNNIRYRYHDLDMTSGDNGNPLLDDEYYLMEIKTLHALPLWLTSILTDCQIFPSSFSKYGKIHEKNIKLMKEPSYV